MEPVSDLQAMDAVAAERGMVLAFRACEDGDEFEPVYMSVERAGVGDENETAMIALTDRNGMSLGRYVLSRARLDAALAESGDSSAADCFSTEQLR